MVTYKKGTYYIGRVIKRGLLDYDNLTEAILKPKPITDRGYDWTFISAQKGEINNVEFVYAKLCKYSPDAEVTVVDTIKGEEVKQDEPNLSIASSPFVYIPEFSGIAFLKVSSNIEPTTFMKRFATLINKRYDNFFVDCEVEPVSDLRTFADKLLKLESIYCLYASISPPNPLFGPLWGDLKNYLKDRKTDKMSIKEESAGQNPIATDIVSLIKGVADQTPGKPPLIKKNICIGDAAILMAVDGYGSGVIKGKQRGESVVIKTSKTIKNFSFNKEPQPEELFEKAYKILKKIKEDRHMKHEE